MQIDFGFCPEVDFLFINVYVRSSVVCEEVKTFDLLILSCIRAVGDLKYVLSLSLSLALSLSHIHPLYLRIVKMIMLNDRMHIFVDFAFCSVIIISSDSLGISHRAPVGCCLL